MNLDHIKLHADARRARTLAMNRYVFGPIAAFFRRLARPEPRKAAVFPAVRGC